MTPPASSDADELEALLQFLYLAPVGLVQTSADGDIVMINPMSAQLLMPLCRDGELVNLFVALGDLAPDLRQRALAPGAPHGMVCDGMQLQVDAGSPGGRPAQILSLTLLKLDESRLMAVLTDVSASVQRDRALRQSQAWIDTIIAGIRDYALMSLDSDGKVHCWNPSVGRVTGYDADGSVGRSCALFYPDDALPPVRLLDRLHDAGRDGWSLDEGWRRRADGSRFWGSCLIAPLDLRDDPQPGEPAFSLIIRDLSDGKDGRGAPSPSVTCAPAVTADAGGAANDALIQFLYQAPIGLLQTSLDGEITMINPMSAQLLMPLVQDGNLLNLFDVLERVAPELRQLAAQAGSNDGVICEGLRFEHRIPGPEGTQRLQILSIRLLKLDQSTLVASISDATSAVRREQDRLALELRDASRIDPLTALPNRKVAMERIAAAVQRSRSDPAYFFAVMFIDCDRFDRVNVTLGTQVGDELLRLIGERLNRTIRQADGVGGPRSNEPAAARLNSDQFVLVLQDTRSPDVHGVAQRVVDALARPFPIGNELVHVTASLGVVLRDHAAEDAEDVLQDASIAMHAAKRAGGARYHVFDPGMKERASRLGALESDLRRAIGAQQLFVVYQPIVGMVDGACVGVEALVRWRHPQRGIVPPVEFIGIAEETGLIGALGEFVLNESCRQLAAWRRELGALAPRTISVNLSRAQLLGAVFVAQVRSALASSGLPARSLQLEITESLAAQDDDVIAQLHELKALGLTLALDDFGTGYSSLSSLHQLPVDVVKIDRSFVCQLESSAHHRVLIEATVMVAQSLGMTTVAEGIETAGQLEALKSLRCDKGQGYLFSKPMSSTVGAQWLVGRKLATC